MVRFVLIIAIFWFACHFFSVAQNKNREECCAFLFVYCEKYEKMEANEQTIYEEARDELVVERDAKVLRETKS